MYRKSVPYVLPHPTVLQALVDRRDAMYQHATSRGMAKWYYAFHVWRATAKVERVIDGKSQDSWYKASLRQAYLNGRSLSTMDDFIAYLDETLLV